MRIVGGQLRGRRFRAPKGDRTRPTSDRVREALFHILPSCKDLTILDLFAGSGALGLECLSRGAARAVFVDRHADACRVIRENLDSLGLSDRAAVHPRSAQQALGRLSSDFDLVFADPPYADAARLLAPVFRRCPLRAGGILITELSSRTELVPPAGLTRIDQRTYGDTSLYLWQAAEVPPPTAAPRPKGSADDPNSR